MGFCFRLESVASPDTPQQAIRELCGISRRLGIGVICEVNGIEAFAFPHTEPEQAISLWERGRLDVRSHNEDLSAPQCSKCGQFLTGVRREMRLAKCARCA